MKTLNEYMAAGYHLSGDVKLQRGYVSRKMDGKKKEVA